MYVRRIEGRDFRSFARLDVEFGLPGAAPLSNITLLVGPNGSGKTSLLRALTLACAGESLSTGGFRSRYSIRRGDPAPERAWVTATIQGHDWILEREGEVRLHSQVDRFGDQEKVSPGHIGWTKEQWRAYQLDANTSASPTYFLAAYHASRRAEASDTYSKGARAKSRSERYERVAGLFEEHVDLVPLGSWLLDSDRVAEAADALDELLPREVEVHRELVSEELFFRVDGVLLPTSALSDGYQAFLAWTGDLLHRLAAVAPTGLPLREIPGVVLIDEVDLHLHPAWQRQVLHRLAAAFPRLQIIATTHSPLVLGSVRHEQVRVLRSDQGLSEVLLPSEVTWGRSADQLLASPFFGLDSTRDIEFASALRAAEQKAAEGDLDDAIQYAKLLARGGEEP